MSDPTSPRTHRLLDAAELVLWPALLIFGSLVAWEVLQQGTEASRPNAFIAPSNVVEAEDMHLAALSRSFRVEFQPTDSFPGGRWCPRRQFSGER